MFNRILFAGRNGISYDCGGVLITKQYVLTAGHCVQDLGISVEVYNSKNLLNIFVTLTKSCTLIFIQKIDCTGRK